MQDADVTHAMTEAPAEHSGGFPPFDQTTFPSQIFWLVVTFAFLFVVLWRMAGPRIQGAIALRRDAINKDLDEAARQRDEAEAAGAAYQTALSNARSRARELAEENRKRIVGEIEAAKAKADAEAQIGHGGGRTTHCRQARRSPCPYRQGRKRSGGGHRDAPDWRNGFAGRSRSCAARQQQRLS